jgi:hypothetical protein
VDKAVKGRKRDAPIRGTKSGKGKRLPAPDELDTWIAEWVAPEDRLCRAPLFANPSTGKRWKPSSIRRTWEAACRAVGIEGISGLRGLQALVRHRCRRAWRPRAPSPDLPGSRRRAFYAALCAAGQQRADPGAAARQGHPGRGRFVPHLPRVFGAPLQLRGIKHENWWRRRESNPRPCIAISGSYATKLRLLEVSTGYPAVAPRVRRRNGLREGCCPLLLGVPLWVTPPLAPKLGRALQQSLVWPHESTVVYESVCGSACTDGR